MTVSLIKPNRKIGSTHGSVAKQNESTMSRHRKFVKSEKSKTKLKSKLPKGLNVTKTEFKIKKIVIREQIKDTTLIQDGAIIRSSNIKVNSIADCGVVTLFASFIGTSVKTATSQCHQSERRAALSE